MKPQNQRKRERAREKKRKKKKVSETECLFALHAVPWTIYYDTHISTKQATGTLVYTCTHYLSATRLHLIAVKPLLLVGSLIAQLISECRVTFNCLAPYTSHVLQHTQISQKQSERQRGVGESMFVVSGWHFEHSSYDWRSSLPFLFSTKQLRPSLSCRRSWVSLCF